jgi:hypothetical protein
MSPNPFSLAGFTILPGTPVRLRHDRCGETREFTDLFPGEDGPSIPDLVMWASRHQCREPAGKRPTLALAAA